MKKSIRQIDIEFFGEEFVRDRDRNINSEIRHKLLDKALLVFFMLATVGWTITLIKIMVFILKTIN